MWSRSTHAAVGRLLRWVAVAAAAALTAGCFQPLYGEHAAGPGAVAPNVRDAFATVEVDQISAPNGTPEARIAVELRNNVIYELTGGEAAAIDRNESGPGQAGESPMTHEPIAIETMCGGVDRHVCVDLHRRGRPPAGPSNRLGSVGRP